MRASGPTRMVHREWRRIAATFAPLVEAALDVRDPEPALKDALARILGDPMLRVYLGQGEP
jgi:hypothetical protein